MTIFYSGYLGEMKVWILTKLSRKDCCMFIRWSLPFYLPLVQGWECWWAFPLQCQAFKLENVILLLSTKLTENYFTWPSRGKFSDNFDALKECSFCTVEILCIWQHLQHLSVTKKYIWCIEMAIVCLASIKISCELYSNVQNPIVLLNWVYSSHTLNKCPGLQQCKSPWTDP